MFLLTRLYCIRSPGVLTNESILNIFNARGTSLPNSVLTLYIPETLIIILITEICTLVGNSHNDNLKHIFC